jgi:hypothetical protein
MGSADVADAVAPVDGDRPTKATPKPEANVRVATVRTTTLFGTRNAITLDTRMP